MPSISDYMFYPMVMERTPYYPFTRYDVSINQIIRDPFFITAISLSSKSLYEALERKDFSSELLAEKEKFSIWQYYNRMCYRPTPFGLSAGVSTVTWDRESSVPQSIEKDQVKQMINYEHDFLIAQRLIKRRTNFSPIYILNPSLYRVGDEYRYIKYVWDNEGKRSFFIESLELTDALKNILSYFQRKRHLEELVSYIASEYGITSRQSKQFSKELIERQVILSELLPNIAGRDYCQRVIETMGNHEVPVSNKAEIQSLLAQDPIPLSKFISNGPKASNKINKLAGFKANDKNALYVNLERNRRMKMSFEFQEKLAHALYCLEKIVPDDENDALIKFKNDFERKFGLRWIPLMVALDPEVGVGYCNLGKDTAQCDLIENIGAKCPNRESTNIKWSHHHKFILDRWNNSLKGKDTISTIELTETDLQHLHRSTGNDRLAPSIAVLFRTIGSDVYIEEAGGASALALIGRFTAFNEAITTAAKHLSEIEQSANPEIIFAEIVHLNDLKSANIDRRASLRQYEIPIATGSDVDYHYQIALNDLWISVVDDEIVIWSKRLKKRIIPRLSSAFNFIKSQLPVFRFLCELQFQNIRTNFKLDLAEIIPDLSFYPRVKYKSAILHLASWKLDKDSVNQILAIQELTDRLMALKEIAMKLHWPKRVSVNRQDNYIVIDTDKQQEMLLLLQLFKKNQPLIIKEFPFVDNHTNTNDQHEDNYISQHVALLYQTQLIYLPVAPPSDPISHRANVRRSFLPGSNWTYFKIYCHPGRSNEILIRSVLPLCERWLDAGFIKKWFFIRYNDPDYHLRIRINSDPVNTGLLIKGFNQVMTSLADIGIVRDFKVDVYEREIERYGKDIIESLEKAFFASTRLVMSFINYSLERNIEKSQFQAAYSSVSLLLDCFQLDLQDKIDLLEQSYLSMKAEFVISNTEKELLKSKFRDLKENDAFLSVDQIIDKLKLRGEAEYFRFTYKEVYRIVRDASPDRKSRVLGDIIHMHLNRLFVTFQRKNEMVVYYCLWRHYTSESGRHLAASSGLFANQHCINKSQ